MPIQPLNVSSYTRIPDDEDITPLDRDIAKKIERTEKSARFCSLVAVVVSILIVLGYFGYEFATGGDENIVTIYSTSSQRQFNTEAFTPLKTSKSFTNIACSKQEQPESDSDQVQKHSSLQCENYISANGRLIVYRNMEFQKIIGFGGAFTESSAHNYYQLPSSTRERILRMYFGEREGIELNMGRIHINSCDFSLSSYNFDSIENDFELEFFDTEVTHDNIEIIPFLLEAIDHANYPIKLVASPWSPPAWMKEPINNVSSMTGSAVPNGLKDDPKIKLAWARYISKFISAYNHKGIPIWALTPQNEPEFPAPWEACAYTASYERDFIASFLGPVIKSQHPDLLLLGFDHNKDNLKYWTEVLFGLDSEATSGGNSSNLSAEAFLDGMAFHWYGGIDRWTDGTYGYNNVNASHHLVPDKIMINTEGCSCPGVILNSWIRAERLAHDIIFDLNNFAQGWIDWNLLVDTEGGPNHLKNFCDASLVAKDNFVDIHVQPKYYYFGHFSKFIRPDSTRLRSIVVGNYKFEEFDPNIQPNMEIAAFACEHSVRQMWSFHPEKNYLYLTSLTALYENEDEKIQLCLAFSKGSRKYLRTAHCATTDPTFKILTFEILDNSQKGKNTKISLKQFREKESGKCLSLADDVRESGALLELADCLSSKNDNDHQTFNLNAATGEITVLKEQGLCLTAGWPLLSSVSAKTPKGEIVNVVMNEALVSTSVDVVDAVNQKIVSIDMPARSIHTIVFK